MNKPLALAALCLVTLTGCSSTESSRTLETPTVASYDTNYAGPRHDLAIGRFSNSSPYLRGIFTEGPDRLGNQARTILKTHLSQTQRFNLFDRENLTAIEQENEFSGTSAEIEGAEILITGQVTEFGRRTVGDKQLFGIFGRGKRQVAYSKVSLSVVDARTSRVVVSVQGAGEFTLSNREVVGFGSTSGYDSTLNGKVLNLSITNAVDKLVAGLEAGAWGMPAE